MRESDINETGIHEKGNRKTLNGFSREVIIGLKL